MYLMFTGIVQEIGTIEKIEPKNGLLEITISCDELINDLEVGDSIAIDGCCQTVIASERMRAKQPYTANDTSNFTIQATEETLQKTIFRNYKEDSKINLEAPLRVSDKLSGHLVSGHIDDVGEVSSVITFEENKIIWISFKKDLKEFIAPKGSISVNGVSLTVIDVKNKEFSFTLIPFTNKNTNLGLIRIGDLVNLEIDLVSRYLVNYLEGSREKCKS